MKKCSMVLMLHPIFCTQKTHSRPGGRRSGTLEQVSWLAPPRPLCCLLGNFRPNGWLSPRTRPPRIQWRHRSGLSPDSLFSADLEERSGGTQTAVHFFRFQFTFSPLICQAAWPDACREGCCACRKAKTKTSKKAVPEHRLLCEKVDGGLRLRTRTENRAGTPTETCPFRS